VKRERSDRELIVNSVMPGVFTTIGLNVATHSIELTNTPRVNHWREQIDHIPENLHRIDELVNMATALYIHHEPVPGAVIGGIVALTVLAAQHRRLK
jgi:hypothetical protein